MKDSWVYLFWEELDRYLTRHTDLKFSHGICPECAKKLYPEYRSKKEKEEFFAVVRCDNSIEVQSLVDILQIGKKTEVKMVLAITRKEHEN